jgi:hypothetical protein
VGREAIYELSSLRGMLVNGAGDLLMLNKSIYFDVDLEAWANVWSIALSWAQCAGRFLGIIGRDPSVSKSNQLHVDIFFSGFSF